MSDNGLGKIVVPTRGKCVQCGNTIPCLAHTGIVLKKRDGSDAVFENLPALLGAVIARMDEIERKLNILTCGDTSL